LFRFRFVVLLLFGRVSSSQHIDTENDADSESCSPSSLSLSLGCSLTLSLRKSFQYAIYEHISDLHLHYNLSCRSIDIDKQLRNAKSFGILSLAFWHFQRVGISFHPAGNRTCLVREGGIPCAALQEANEQAKRRAQPMTSSVCLYTS